MSSDMYVFDNSFYSDQFSPFLDSAAIDAFGIFQENDESAASLHQLASALLSSSPPSAELQNLSLSHLAPEVKTEECQLGFNNNSFSPHETALKLMHRSYSSSSFDNSRADFSFRPHFDSVLEHTQILSSPETAFQSGQIRRVCSTGDLQKMKTSMQTRSVLSSSPLSAEKSFMEEANFKVGRYSAEERKERIDRYRAKRTQRNFNKTIKYACRKTLADTRPRIRGRFARNDEAGEIPKASMFQRYEDDDELWTNLQMEGLHEEDEEQIAPKRAFFNVHYQNYRF
ncbi:zinc finger protein CONSTANS-LIKE 2-like isoform X2 [Salvia miltiorrhiza]|uniref:zinc finger protein CONSTANS-LIKE 2-like isoform X2 n=1 Tax=Salvia miltiorrhiza TaxID=226208 RepID=UPI0025AC9FD5|nr:zinc finger protein CONSTANS-LIKE 2-like isoform X2 [Salvia miltiorrhiza]